MSDGRVTSPVNLQDTHVKLTLLQAMVALNYKSNKSVYSQVENGTIIKEKDARGGSSFWVPKDKIINPAALNTPAYTPEVHTQSVAAHSPTHSGVQSTQPDTTAIVQHYEKLLAETEKLLTEKDDLIQNYKTTLDALNNQLKAAQNSVVLHKDHAKLEEKLDQVLQRRSWWERLFGK